MQLRNIILCTLAAAGTSLLPATLRAQSTTNSTNPAATVRKPVIKKPKPISKELSFGLRLTTNGWGLFAERGTVHSDEGKEADKFYDTRVIQAEFGEIKHPKQTKYNNDQGQSVPGGGKSRPYIFGKINNFYALNLSYGNRKMIAGKPEPGTVSINWVYMGGVSLGMLKPYYLDGYVPQDNLNGQLVRKTFRYEDSKESFLNNNYIIGAAGFSEGIGQTKFIPGLHLKTALHFDFSNNKRWAYAIEAGAAASVYSQKIEIMANQTAYPYTFNLFASFQFGRRW